LIAFFTILQKENEMIQTIASTTQKEIHEK